MKTFWFSNFRFAASQQDGSSYHVLLIITDGVITDMEQTKNAIVQVILPYGYSHKKSCIVGMGNLFIDIYEVSISESVTDFDNEI